MRVCGVGIQLVAVSALVGSCQRIDWRAYSIQAKYFDPKRFQTTADCLTEANLFHVPLDLCMVADARTAKPKDQGSTQAADGLPEQ